jgi:hypothetical protein
VEHEVPRGRSASRSSAKKSIPTSSRARSSSRAQSPKHRSATSSSAAPYKTRRRVVSPPSPAQSPKDYGEPIEVDENETLANPDVIVGEEDEEVAWEDEYNGHYVEEEGEVDGTVGRDDGNSNGGPEGDNIQTADKGKAPEHPRRTSGVRFANPVAASGTAVDAVDADDADC